MTAPGTGVVEYHLRRLDGEGLAAFVADLWEARGYDVTRDGEAVVARHGPDAVHIRVVTSGSRLPASPEGTVDVVVAPDGSADRPDGVRVVDAATLAEMLDYAVDRGVARELCRRHLGGPPAELTEPRTTRVRRRAGSVVARRSPLVLGVLVVLAVGGAAGLAVLPGPGGETSVVTPDEAIATPVPVRSSTGDGVAGNGVAGAAAGASTGTSLPPGVTPSGIENVTALAAAHERALGNRSHTIWVDWYRPESLRPNGSRVQRDIDIAADGDRYLIETSEETQTGRTHLGAVYHDGFASYAAVWNETTGSYGRVFRIDPRQNAGPTPESIREQIVTRYLSTPETNVTRIEQDGKVLYRIVGSGPPDTAASVNFRTYSVEALVDSRGFVRDLSVEATVDHPDTGGVEEFRIRREITYDRVGETTVDAPEWYERQADTDEE